MMSINASADKTDIFYMCTFYMTSRCKKERKGNERKEKKGQMLCRSYCHLLVVLSFLSRDKYRGKNPSRIYE